MDSPLLAHGDCQSNPVAAAYHHEEQEAGNTEADVAVGGVVLGVADVAGVNARQAQEAEVVLEDADACIVAEEHTDTCEADV